MKKLEDYTQEELIALNKRLSVYAATWYFKYFRMYKMNPEDKEKPFIQAMLEKKAGIKEDLDNTPARQRVANNIQIEILNFKLNSLLRTTPETDNDVLKIKYEISALNTISSCLYWFGGVYEDHVEHESKGEPYYTNGVAISIEEMEFELHMNDAMNISNGVATDYQAYEYVWNTLQYLNIKELGKLLSFIERGIKCKWQLVPVARGRRTKVCEIKQVDIETGETVGTYTTRAELIEKTGIKKSHLSQCIKTSKDNPDNRDEWKKWIGENGRKYGFVEVQ